MKTVVVERGDCFMAVSMDERLKTPVGIRLHSFSPESGLDGFTLSITHDEAVHLAAALFETSILRCSPELREKFNNLVRDVQK